MVPTSTAYPAFIFICHLSSIHSPPNSLNHLLKPPSMDPRITRQLRMKARPKYIALSNRHNIAGLLIQLLLDILSYRRRPTWQRRHHLHISQSSPRIRSPRRRNDRLVALQLRVLRAGDAGQDTLYDGRTDENGAERLVLGRHNIAGGVGQEGQVEIGVEALDLAPEMVPIDSDVEAANEFLAALLGAIRRLGEQNQSCAGPPRRLAGQSVSAWSCDLQL